MNTDEQTKICKRQGGGLHSPLRRACVERGGQPLETFGDHLSVAPNADAEVLGHLEECTGYNGSLVNLLQPRDRKSTRLNSSHGYISYAVFCLKKKKQTNTHSS